MSSLPSSVTAGESLPPCASVSPSLTRGPNLYLLGPLETRDEGAKGMMPVLLAQGLNASVPSFPTLTTGVTP